MKLNSGRNLRSTTVNDIQSNNETRDLFTYIHRELTKKKKSLSKEFTDNYLIDICNIKSIYERIMQQIQHFNANSVTTNIELFYTDKSNQCFDNFVEFETYVKSKDKVSTAVNIQFNITYQLVGNIDIKMMKVDVVFTSRLGLKFSEKFPVFLREMIISEQPVVKITIEHDDFITAKNIENTCSDWIESLPKTSNKEWVANVVDRLPAIFRLISMLVIFYALFKYSFSLGDSIQVLAQYFVLAIASLLYIPNFVGRIIQIWREKFVFLVGLSYVKLTSADEAKIKEEKLIKSKGNRAVVFQVVIGIIASIISYVIIEVFLKILGD